MGVGDGTEDGGETGDFGDLAVTERRERRGWRRVEQSIGEVGASGDREFGSGRSGHDDLGGLPHEGIGNAFSTGFGHPDSVAAVVVPSWTKVKTGDCMGGPRSSRGGLFVDKNFGTGRSQWSSIVVEGAVQLSMR